MILKSLLFLQFDKIRFGFSTKLFNNQMSPFFSNMSLEIGDDPQKVLNNRKIFIENLQMDLDRVAYQHQIHSDIITYVDKPGFIGDSDAMFTDKKNLALTAGSADCTTIYIYDSINEVIAAVHSGWRGSQKRIVEKTLVRLSKEFEVKNENLFVYVAPSISQKNYQVGEEVYSLFDGKYVKKIDNSFFLDVVQVNYDMIKNFGIPIKNIQVSNLCSFENENLFHSYRRDKENSGRAWGLIYMV